METYALTKRIICRIPILKQEAPSVEQSSFLELDLRTQNSTAMKTTHS